MKTVLCLLALVAFVHCRPQQPIDRYDSTGPAEPYNFQYKVENAPTNTYFGQNENGDTAGGKAGSFYVLLPDGRTMTVNYVANAQGFVPKVSFAQGVPTARF